LQAANTPSAQQQLALLNAQADGRYVASLEQKKQITLKVGANTSILGAKGCKTSRIEDIALAVNWTNNVVFRNFEMYAPIDLFPE
jgi:pectate lyase